MPVRDIVEIDQELCDGCGDCVSACAEGAIEIIDGTAQLLSDTYCDGLGACLGHCPQGAITVIRRNSEEFDEAAVEQHLARIKAAAGPAAPPMPMVQLSAAPGPMPGASGGGCPGSRSISFDSTAVTPSEAEAERPSRLGHWPIQLHLVPPTAPFFSGADVVLAADCVAYAVGGFHARFLDGRALAIACPKLDSHQEVYVEKLVSMIDEAAVQSLTVMVMEVPCCSGLVRLMRQAAAAAHRQIPVTCVVVGVRGNIVAEERVA
jgi:NAD-dependent dihydropyrimidine dehydrogenase PreA subunit